MKSIFFIVFIALYLAGNYYVFYRAWVAMPPSTIGYSILIAIAAIVIISPILFFSVGDYLPIWLSSTLYTIGTSWICIFLYALLFNLIKDLIRISHLIPQDALHKYTRDNWAGFTLMVGFVLMLMICGYLKYRTKDRVEIVVNVEKKIEKKDSLKVVAISDLHLGYSISANELKGWVETINKEKPDIVIIAGDIIDNSVRPLNAGDFAKNLREIKAPLGIYACLGNHEYISGVEASKKFIADAGIKLLQDNVALIDSSFYIVGRDDRSNIKRKPLSHLVENLDKSKPIILLDHQPMKLEDAEKNGIDFQFSGHTHQGQIWPISLITDHMYEVSHGYLKKGDATNIYVSSGIGIWGGKFRIGTQSEYVVVNIKGKK